MHNSKHSPGEEEVMEKDAERAMQEGTPAPPPKNRLILILLSLASPLLLGLQLEEMPGADWLFSALVMIVPTALMAMGAPACRSGAWRLGWGILALVQTVAVWILIALSRLPEVSLERNLPMAALLLLVGLWLLPALAVTIAYLVAFDRFQIDPHLWARLRRDRRASGNEK